MEQLRPRRSRVNLTDPGGLQRAHSQQTRTIRRRDERERAGSSRAVRGVFSPLRALKDENRTCVNPAAPRWRPRGPRRAGSGRRRATSDKNGWAFSGVVTGFVDGVDGFSVANDINERSLCTRGRGRAAIGVAAGRRLGRPGGGPCTCVDVASRAWRRPRRGTRHRRPFSNTLIALDDGSASAPRCT